jgi:hypothetical protein
MKTPLKFCFCGSRDGRCKLSNGLIICNTHKNAKKGDRINGYQCTEENPAAFVMMGVVK